MVFDSMGRGRGNFPPNGDLGETQKVGREVSIETMSGVLLHHQIDRALKSYVFDQGLVNHDSQPTEIDHAVASLDEATRKEIEAKTKADYENIFAQMSACQYDLRSGQETHPLTKLANKKMTARIFDILKTHPDFIKGNVGAAMVRMDLDGFKATNDKLGHDAGDQALKTVAQKLNDALKHLRPADLAAHYHGDEFAIILTSIKPNEGETIEQTVEHIVQRIIQEIEMIDIPNGKKLSASAGYKIIRPGISDDFPSADNDTDLASGISKNFKYVSGIEKGSQRVVNCEKTEEEFLKEKGITPEQLLESKIRSQLTRPFDELFPNGIPTEVQTSIDQTVTTALAAKKSEAK